MDVFDDFTRNDTMPATHAEDQFTYLNRSARPEFAAARNIIQRWFALYPQQYQAELRSRLRSRSDVDHPSAVFELAIHFLLVYMGAKLIPHPHVPSSPRRPDFLVIDAAGLRFYLETTLVTFTTREQKAEEARKNAVYDILNRLVRTPDWFLWLEVNGAPRTPAPAQEIARFVNAHLSELSSDSVNAAYEAGRYDDIPQWSFSHDEWHITFRPIPRKPDAPDRPNHRPLGMFSGGFDWVDHRTPLRDAILEKASAYGELGEAFIVATNVPAPIDDIDISEALLGKEQFTVAIPEVASEADPTVTPSRTMDGVWTLPSGPRNTRLGAVLIVQDFYPWALSACKMRLFHNPWATRPIRSVLTQFPQAMLREGRLDMVEGLSPGAILSGSQHRPEVAG